VVRRRIVPDFQDNPSFKNRVKGLICQLIIEMKPYEYIRFAKHLDFLSVHRELGYKIIKPDIFGLNKTHLL
jgi:hypothetical protein